MKIIRVLNNSAVISENQEHEEIIALGKGIAYGKKAGDEFFYTFLSGIVGGRVSGQQSRQPFERGVARTYHHLRYAPVVGTGSYAHTRNGARHLFYHGIDAPALFAARGEQ